MAPKRAEVSAGSSKRGAGSSNVRLMSSGPATLSSSSLGQRLAGAGARGRRSTRAMLASVAPLLDQHATTVLCRSRACKAVFELESSLPYCSPTNGPPTHQPSPSAYSCRPPLAHYSLVHVTGELSFMLRTERSERSRRGGSPRRHGRAGDQSKTTPHRSAVRCVRRPRPPIPVTGRESTQREHKRA